MTRRSAVAAALIGATTLAVYFPVLASLARQWASDENSSHGFIVVPFALLFGWRARKSLAAEEPNPHVAGLVLAVLSVLGFLAGQLAAELFLARLSLLGLIAGTILFLWGPAHLRKLSFSLALLLLAIPLPSIILNQIAFPLQLLASRAGEAVVSAAGIPILREGNVLFLPEMTLEVVEACSGIRSLASLVTLALILGKLSEPRPWARVALVVLAIPVAIAANAARVAGTGLAAAWVGRQAAEGFFHSFSGWLVFVAAFSALMLCARLLRQLKMPAAGGQHVVVGLS
jgi:exosortase